MSKMADTVQPVAPAPVIWEGKTRITWHTNRRNSSCQFLRVGGLYAGEVHLVRNFATVVGIGAIIRPWRACLMTEDAFFCVGWYASEQEAMDALVDHVIKELAK